MSQTAESFWAKVDKSGECWLWTRSCNNTGYGTYWRDGKCYVAHRIAAWLSGIVDTPSAPKDSFDETHVLHTCDIRKCCNPLHFFLGSYSDNQLDCYAKNRANKYKGSAHANSKLTSTEVKEIRYLYDNKVCFQTELAELYSVSQRCISLVVRRESYL